MLEIIWKEPALKQIENICIYLTEEFSANVTQKFLSKLTEKVERVARFPESGQRTPYKLVYRLKLDRYHSIYYRASKTQIIILYIWDGRQEPRKNKFNK
jgi:plasmid stabilization system protein ParE